MLNPLILKGNLRVNDIDVSEAVTSFMFSGQRDTIDIPATFGASKSFRAGSDSYEVEISYLLGSNTATPTQLTNVFWEALADTDGTVTVSGTFAPGPASSTNPRYTATAVVTGVGIGGEVNTLAQDSQTFPLVGRPVVSAS